MAFTDIEIREALQELIELKAPKAIVWPWWAHDGPPETWSGKFLSDLDLDEEDEPRVHGYIFTRLRSGTIGEFNFGSNCTDDQFVYQIRAFHYYSLGDETANSDYLFNAELDEIKRAYNNLRLIEGEVEASTLERLAWRVNPLDWDINLSFEYGDKLLHSAIAEVTIDPVLTHS